jgi:hypothetical protein
MNDILKDFTITDETRLIFENQVVKIEVLYTTQDERKHIKDVITEKLKGLKTFYYNQVQEKLAETGIKYINHI